MADVDGDVSDQGEEGQVEGADTEDLKDKKSVLGQAAEGEQGVIGSATDPGSNESQKNLREEAQEAEIEEYDLTLSEGSPLTEDDLKAVAQYAEKYNLSQEEAQQLITDREKVYSRGLESSRYERMVRENHAKLSADPDFSGERFQQTIDTIRPVITAFGDRELAEALQDPVIGSHPAVARFLLKLGKAMQSDTFVGKGAGGLKAAPAESPLQSMYPDFFKKEGQP